LLQCMKKAMYIQCGKILATNVGEIDPLNSKMKPHTHFRLPGTNEQQDSQLNNEVLDYKGFIWKIHTIY
jgi:hypothetical protein